MATASENCIGGNLHILDVKMHNATGLGRI